LTATPTRLWHASLRLRLTVAGTALAAVIFTASGAIVIILYHQSLTDSVRHTVAHTAAEVAAQITPAGRLPDPIPMPVCRGCRFWTAGITSSPGTRRRRASPRYSGLHPA
jgi:hypothetical protein